MSERFSEHEFLAWLRETQAGSGLPVPIGDDAAVVPTAAETLVAVDTVMECQHLDSGPDLPERLARKALRVNLSDIAAMGGRPETVFCALGLPTNAEVDLAQRFTEALLEDCARYQVVLAGGDTVMGGDYLFASITVLGRALTQPVRRSGAAVGDWVLVTGSFGGSILGKHELFEPRLAAAAELVRLGPPTAMADVSDGLLRDLANIADASGCGAMLRAEAIPISADAEILAQRSGQTALEHALHDGEDFELIFTMAPEAAEKLLKEWNQEPKISVAGAMVEQGLWIEEAGQRRSVLPGGYDHGLSPR